MAEHSIQIKNSIKTVLELTLDKVSDIFSKTIKKEIKLILDTISIQDFTSLCEKREAENEDTVGVTVELVGDAPFKFLFMINYKDSLTITDLILSKKIGTTTEFNIYVESAVQEIGNILASTICNFFSAKYQLKMKPLPPIVLRDFGAIIFQEYLKEAAMENNYLLIVESNFSIVGTGINCKIFLMPYLNSNNLLSSLGGE